MGLGVSAPLLSADEGAFQMHPCGRGPRLAPTGPLPPSPARSLVPTLPGWAGEGVATHRGPPPHGHHHSSQGSEEGPGGNQLLKPHPHNPEARQNAGLVPGPALPHQPDQVPQVLEYVGDPAVSKENPEKFPDLWLERETTGTWDTSLEEQEARGPRTGRQAAVLGGGCATGPATACSKASRPARGRGLPTSSTETQHPQLKEGEFQEIQTHGAQSTRH